MQWRRGWGQQEERFTMTTEKEDLEVKLLQLEIEERQRPVLTRPRSIVTIVALISTIGALVFDAKWARLEAKEASFTLAEAKAELTGIQRQIETKKTEITELETSIGSLEASFEEAAEIAEARDNELKDTEKELTTLVAAVQRATPGVSSVNQLKRTASTLQKKREGPPVVFQPAVYWGRAAAVRRTAKSGGPKILDAELDRMRRKVPIGKLLGDLNLRRGRKR
jgi:chromosome segregation ATPase